LRIESSKMSITSSIIKELSEVEITKVPNNQKKIDIIE